MYGLLTISLAMFALQLTELLFQPQLTVGALDGGDALGPLLPQHFFTHVETLQENGHRHVHFHRLLVEQRRDAILEDFSRASMADCTARGSVVLSPAASISA